MQKKFSKHPILAQKSPFSLGMLTKPNGISLSSPFFIQVLVFIFADFKAKRKYIS